MAKDVLPPEPGFGEVSITGPQNGALFVDAKVLNAMAAPIIKIPPGAGGAVAPRKRRRA